MKLDSQRPTLTRKELANEKLFPTKAWYWEFLTTGPLSHFVWQKESETENLKLTQNKHAPRCLAELSTKPASRIFLQVPIYTNSQLSS